MKEFASKTRIKFMNNIVFPFFLLYYSC